MRSGALTLPALVWLLVGTALAHPPLPASVTRPESAAEAWNVLRLVTGNLERLLQEERLPEVPEQAALTSPALRLLPREPHQPGPVAEACVAATLQAGALAQAAQAGDLASARARLASFRAALQGAKPLFLPAETEAEIYACPMHPECLSPRREALCPRCSMSLLQRRIPYSFVYMAAGESSLRLTAILPAPLQPDVGVEATLHLQQADGTPVRPEDLLIVHTEPIHLLLIDAALAEYHHEHPWPGRAPGEYRFRFTPHGPGPFRLLADVVPAASAVQEYARTELGGPVPPFSGPPPQESLTATIAGRTFRLRAEGEPPQAGAIRQLRLRLTREPAETPETALEPVMNAFAHLVGFYEDGLTVLHLHPEGPEITDPGQRGGPDLTFRLYPPKSGWLHLFAQVQIDGHPLYAPFCLHIE